MNTLCPRVVIAAFLLPVAALSARAAAVESVPYYRLFQGVKLANVTQQEFQAQLGSTFIPALPRDIGPLGAIAYLPALPPEGKPAGVPDEIALIAYESRAAYEASRQTEKGRAYGDLHWTLFDQAQSKRGAASALGASIQPDAAYDVAGKAIDWQAGHSTLFLGLRKPGVAPADFLAKMHRHVNEVQQAFGPLGLDGYVMLANDVFELAFQHWTSRDAAAAAFQSPAGRDVARTAGEILTPLQFTEAAPFQGTIQPGQALNVAIPRQ